MARLRRAGSRVGAPPARSPAGRNEGSVTVARRNAAPLLGSLAGQPGSPTLARGLLDRTPFRPRRTDRETDLGEGIPPP